MVPRTEFSNMILFLVKEETKEIPANLTFQLLLQLFFLYLTYFKMQKLHQNPPKISFRIFLAFLNKVLCQQQKKNVLY